MNPQALIDDIIHLARQAGDAILPWFRSDQLVTEHKADDSPVTNADIAANKVILKGLKALTPDIPILSEESGHKPFAERRQWQCYWLVDPLDGTREFVGGSPDFAVNIALVVDNEPVMGVIYAPVSGDCYWAVKGHGVFKNGQPIHTRKPSSPPLLAVSRHQSLSTLKSHLRDALDFEALAFGSASLKSCMVAEGVADAYVRIGPTGEWDTAASWAIVVEAGGAIVDLDGKPLTFNRSESLENPNYGVLGQLAAAQLFP
ncbi:3'(2'),5'-bisphosphate nucleotidase CysQ [Gallaecimonas pentaromativorans]|uniref:3'(2'),5'-bisphosphate nucleotidase CysQ n=1 Tax=Gallaecimonas pentaromativorans TaxID=584787 RepID=A0A3N1NVE8_9GAMM|nr:3'(2'),5'-bisphosphate nucleotidase CysQ [Gallaecimonas pentaromativorans]ROQ18917.1 3'(2'),5'-bisphosphate nucleotidase [Gallaecimonas pentaromativorans]